MSRLCRQPHRLAAIALCAAALASAAVAQTAPPPPPPPPPATGNDAPPPGAEPLPEVAGDVDLAPQVTIKRRANETIEEARVAGRIVWIKVTPLHGVPYYLVPTIGGNAYVRRDSLDSELSVPMWVLFTF